MADGELSDPWQRNTAETIGAQVDRRPVLCVSPTLMVAMRAGGGARTEAGPGRGLVAAAVPPVPSACGPGRL